VRFNSGYPQSILFQVALLSSPERSRTVSDDEADFKFHSIWQFQQVLKLPFLMKDIVIFIKSGIFNEC